jgi:growth factor-regulated tyrosine kinase substrate
MFRSTSSFDRLLERATSNLLLEPDWNAILAICDSIRSGDTPPKYAITAVKKKFYHENPHVVLYSLTVSLVATLYTFRGLIMSYFRYLSHA